ncbi:MAG: Hsp70 family protein [Clostridia bacterium]
MKLGIDFGTSFSVPATSYLGQNIILLPDGKYGVPSVFFYSDWEGILIGEGAEQAGQGDEAKNLKREIKLALNSKFTVDKEIFTAKQIVGHILSFIKDSAINTASTKLINEPLEGVVISVPARFSHNEKEVIKQAAEIPSSQGGPEFNVLGFIKEPVAAALAYFETALEDNTKVLVYDLGGGTCDIAIVEANSSLQEKYTVIDSDMIRLGGKDWDSKLEQYILNEVEKQSGENLSNNAGYLEKIKREAIITKHSFSECIAGQYRNRVRARVEINGRTYTVPITKALFDELTIDLFYKTLNLTKTLLDRNDGNSITNIICVGGGSNMPQVNEGLKRMFPSKTIQIFEPEKAIAVGAAIYAQYCSDKTDFLSDIAAFSYGSRCLKDHAKNFEDLIVVNLIKKGDKLPNTSKHGFSTVIDNQRQVLFRIIENLNIVDEYDYDKHNDPHIMDVILEMPPNMPEGTSVTLYMTLTMDGIIEVKADDNNGHTITAKKQLYF